MRQFNIENNKFDVVFTSNVKTIEILDNSVLYYHGNELTIGNFDEKISDSSIITIGVVIEGKFYSNWPFLKINKEIEIIDNKNVTHGAIIEMIKKWNFNG